MGWAVGTRLASKPSIAATLARVSALDEWLAAEFIPAVGPGWIDPTRLRPHLPDLLERIGNRWNTDDRRVEAAFFMHSYSWRIAGPATACYLAERRVPELAAKHMAVRFDTEGTAGPPAFRSPRFAGPPGDCQSDVTCGDAAELLLRLKHGLEAHLALTVEALQGHAPLGTRALWALAADAAATAFLLAGAKLGDQERARAEAEAFFVLRSSPLRTKATFLQLEHAGRREVFLRRGSCCLIYRLAGHEYCATCPLIPLDETERRLREYLATSDE